jgi:regulator of nucleoside diphosphate kinase
MTTTMRNRGKPAITMTAADYERLSQLVSGVANTLPDIASELSDELDRTRVLTEGQYPVDTVCMGCEVDFRDDMTRRVQTVTLVYPNEADIAKGKVSVLTPIGTALIGLAVGKSINWKTRPGEMKRLTVLRVREPVAVEPSLL